MVRLTAWDEQFVHQLPEPLPHVVTPMSIGARACSSCCTRAAAPATS